jgi:hypothetical protein
MKALTATALLLVLSTVAFAKQSPVERSRLALVNADINMRLVGAMRENIGSVGAMRERDYFEAPQCRSTLALSLADWSRTCSPRRALPSCAANERRRRTFRAEQIFAMQQFQQTLGKYSGVPTYRKLARTRPAQAPIRWYISSRRSLAPVDAQW